MSKISDQDKKDWQDFLSKKERLHNKDLIKYKKDNNKFSEIDLHGYTLDEANIVIKKFILENYEKNISKLRIVTGKGLHSKIEGNPYLSKKLGILKHSVPDYIKRDKDLMILIKEFKEASLDKGGDGAFYVYLKKNNK